MSRLEYEQWAQDEVSMWPGVSVTFGDRGKHREAVLRFGEAERFVIYPSTPSDSGRGLYNKIADIRRELQAMGAERTAVPKSTRPKSERNPGADMREGPEREHAPVIADPWEALRVLADRPLITKPGAYSDIDTLDYHRNANLLPAPSISASGLKTLLSKSPAHYWFDSTLNPDRPPEQDKAHFNVGKAAHDMLLLSERWPLCYHILPEGYTSPNARTKNFTDDQLAALAAKDSGKTLIRWDDAALVRGMASAIKANPLAAAALANGESEVTLCWQDKETGVWLRARPDFLPHKRRIIPDLKTAADASPKGFQRTIANFGYAQAAALYLDGIETVFGDRPSNWIHVVVEKEPPHVVALYELPPEDIGRGRWLNRRAIRIFADCLSSGKWPGYADQPTMLGLPQWERKVIDEATTPEGAAWGEAA